MPNPLSSFPKKVAHKYLTNRRTCAIIKVQRKEGKESKKKNKIKYKRYLTNCRTCAIIKVQRKEKQYENKRTVLQGKH
jgi:hypothetical protein